MCFLFYSTAFNNDEAKKALQRMGVLSYLIKTYRDEVAVRFPEPHLFRNCLQAISTMCMLKEISDMLIKQRFP
jgi:hypothetical protein